MADEELRKSGHPLYQDTELGRSFQSWKARRPNLFGPQQATSQSEQMTMPCVVAIEVIADGQEHEIKLPNTLWGSTFEKSFITSAKAAATRGKIQSAPSVTLTDGHGRYTSSSTIALRWYYDGGAQSFSETFYIVDKLPMPARANDGTTVVKEWDAILRAGVRQPPDGARVHPYFQSNTDPSQDQQQRDRSESNQRKYETEKTGQLKAVRDALERKVSNLKKGSKK